VAVTSASCEQRPGTRGVFVLETSRGFRLKSEPVKSVAWVRCLFVLSLVCACKRTAGSACDEGEAHCLDAQRELVCEAGKLVETPCRGKAGCSTVRETTSCDISGNRAGDPCSRTEEGAAACADPGAMVTCHAGKFERVACRGPRGCQNVAGQPSCDQSVADIGDTCKQSGSKACSGDRQAVLVCGGGQLGALYACRGPGGCTSTNGKLACDQGVARPGDVCDKGLEGHVACSEDKTALLACRSGSFKPAEKCRAGTRCTVSGQSTSCSKG
jgi:hypothetical protein